MREKLNRSEPKRFIKWTEWVGGAKRNRMGGLICAWGGGASIRCSLRAKWRQRGRKHQHFGLHEGEVGQTCDHLRRLLAQVLLLLRLPVEQEEMDRRWTCDHTR